MRRTKVAWSNSAFTLITGKRKPFNSRTWSRGTRPRPAIEWRWMFYSIFPVILRNCNLHLVDTECWAHSAPPWSLSAYLCVWDSQYRAHISGCSTVGLSFENPHHNAGIKHIMSSWWETADGESLFERSNISKNEKARSRLVLCPVWLFLSVLHQLWNAISLVAPRQVLQPYGIPLLLLRGLHPLAAFLFRLQSPEEAFQVYHLLSCRNNGYCVYNYATTKSEIYTSFWWSSGSTLLFVKRSLLLPQKCWSRVHTDILHRLGFSSLLTDRESLRAISRSAS